MAEANHILSPYLTYDIIITNCQLKQHFYITSSLSRPVRRWRDGHKHLATDINDTLAWQGAFGDYSLEGKVGNRSLSPSYIKRLLRCLCERPCSTKIENDTCACLLRHDRGSVQFICGSECCL